MNTPSHDPCPRWCEEAAGHPPPHRAYLGEITLAPPQRARFAAVTLIGPDGGPPVGVEISFGVWGPAEPYVTALLDWANTEELSGMLIDARKRFEP